MNVAKDRQVRKIDDFRNEATLLRVTQVTESIIHILAKKHLTSVEDQVVEAIRPSCEELATITYCTLATE